VAQAEWLGGDNEILHSQPSSDTWQWEISFIFKASAFINYTRTPNTLKSYLLTTNI